MERADINKKGFTLIELLVVIAIVAILAVVVILTLNPAELLKQARDSTRVSDLSTLKSALAYYLVDRTTPILAADYTHCYTSNSSTQTIGCGGRYSSIATSSNWTSKSAAVNGTGWLGSTSTATSTGPNFTAITTGAPIGQLPLDPVNDNTYFYSYVASTTNNYYEIDAFLESTKYSVTTSTNLMLNDGGSSSTLYEVGSYLNF